MKKVDAASEYAAMLADIEAISDPKIKADTYVTTAQQFTGQQCQDLAEAASKVIGEVDDPAFRVRLRARLASHLARVNG